jgi:hypothetical protein
VFISSVLMLNALNCADICRMNQGFLWPLPFYHPLDRYTGSSQVNPKAFVFIRSHARSRGEKFSGVLITRIPIRVVAHGKMRCAGLERRHRVENRVFRWGLLYQRPTPRNSCKNHVPKLTRLNTVNLCITILFLAWISNDIPRYRNIECHVQ